MVYMYISGKKKLAHVKYYKRYSSFQRSDQRKLAARPADNEVFLITDGRDGETIELNQILSKCQVHTGDKNI